MWKCLGVNGYGRQWGEGGLILLHNGHILDPVATDNNFGVSILTTDDGIITPSFAGSYYCRYFNRIPYLTFHVVLLCSLFNYYWGKVK